MFPFFHQNYLFFSSNGHAGLGGLDIFKAAVAGAPLTNLISMSNSIYWNTGTPDAKIFETSQGRFVRILALSLGKEDVIDEKVNDDNQHEQAADQDNTNGPPELVGKVNLGARKAK